MGDGRLWAFSGDLSTTHFVLNFQRQNQGGPAVAGDGYLVMADLARVRVFRACCDRAASPGASADLPGSVGACLTASGWGGATLGEGQGA